MLSPDTAGLPISNLGGRSAKSEDALERGADGTRKLLSLAGLLPSGSGSLSPPGGGGSTSAAKFNSGTGRGDGLGESIGGTGGCSSGSLDLVFLLPLSFFRAL